MIRTTLKIKDADTLPTLYFHVKITEKALPIGIKIRYQIYTKYTKIQKIGDSLNQLSYKDWIANRSLYHLAATCKDSWQTQKFFVIHCDGVEYYWVLAVKS